MKVIFSMLLICLTALPVHAGMPVSLDQVEPKLIDDQTNEESRKKGEEERRQQEIQRQADEERRREENWRKEEDQRQRERNKAEYSSNNESSKSAQWDWSTSPKFKSDFMTWLLASAVMGVAIYSQSDEEFERTSKGKSKGEMAATFSGLFLLVFGK